jgi:hypothetical protein
MTTTRRIGSVAAVGALTASIALLTGLPTAGADPASTVQWPQPPAASTSAADDLAQLKANQQLLQQQIDQLALGAPAGVPPAGSASLAGSFPRSFLIPGTDTSLLVGGYVKLDVCYWMEGGNAQIGSTELCGLEGNPLLASAPLDSHGTGLFEAAFFNTHSRGVGIFDFTSRESRLRVETRTPTAWGEAQTVWEMDFYGCQSGPVNCNSIEQGPDSQVPRLRLAYATIGGFIAGQAFMPGINLDANPELLDFSEPGTFGVARMPLIGYKWAGPYGFSLGAYLLNPEVDGCTPAGCLSSTDNGGLATSGPPNTGNTLSNLGVNPFKQELPDLNLVARWQQPWGSLQVTSVIQELNLEDGAFLSKKYVGYGGAVETDVHPGWFGWTKDHIGAQVWAGNGLDRFGDNPTGTQPGPWGGLATNMGGAGSGCYGYANVTANGSGGATLVGQSGSTEFPVCTTSTAAGSPEQPGFGNTAHNAASVVATTIVSYGGEANYQHWWTPNLRTNIAYGYQRQDLPTQLIGLDNQTVGLNSTLKAAHLNLIWSPVAFINTGFEGMYGQRTTIWHQRGEEATLDYSFQVKF